MLYYSDLVLQYPAITVVMYIIGNMVTIYCSNRGNDSQILLGIISSQKLPHMGIKGTFL